MEEFLCYYDIEIYPNYLEVGFKLLDKVTKFKFYKDDRFLKEELDAIFYDTVTKLKLFLKNLDNGVLLAGFNIGRYDNHLLRIIANDGLHLIGRKGCDHFLRHLYIESQILISSDKNIFTDTITLNIGKEFKTFYYLDIMKILALDKIKKGLKQCSVNVKSWKLQDLPYPFNQDLNLKEVEEVSKYNTLDLEKTAAIFEQDYVKEELLIRTDSFRNNKTKLNTSRSDLGYSILKQKYCQYARLDEQDLNAFVNPRRMFENKEIGMFLRYDFNFKNKHLKKLHDDIFDIYYTTNFKKIKIPIDDFLSVTIGLGGIHSNDEEHKFEETDKYEIIDADVGSFYPRIIINNKISPPHLKRDVFIHIVENITDERLNFKKQGLKSKAEVYKIAVNSIYGKLGYEYSFIYDLSTMYEVTLNGQFLLLQLIDNLIENGFKVISCNTDGITTIVNKNKKQLYEEICNNWSEKYKYVLEYTNYKSYIRTSVNDYFSILKNGKIKAKGEFSTDLDFNNGIDKQVISKIMIEYYKQMSNKNFINYDLLNHLLKNYKDYNIDIFDFCSSFKSDSSFTTYLEQINYETNQFKLKTLQRTNRFFISKYSKNENIGSIFKQKEYTNERLYIIAKKYVYLLNDYNPNEDYHNYIDFNFYLKELEKRIMAIESKSNYLWKRMM